MHPCPPPGPASFQGTVQASRGSSRSEALRRSPVDRNGPGGWRYFIASRLQRGPRAAALDPPMHFQNFHRRS